MSAFQWSTDPANGIHAFEERHHSPDAGALILWATSAVRSVHYLADLDEVTWQNPIGGYHPDDGDLAHTRWAVSTCITALDLCAAGLGRVFCGLRGKREFSLSTFDPNGKKSKRRAEFRSQLPKPMLNWIDAVCVGEDYRLIKDVRDLFTHSRLPRTVSVGGQHRVRLTLRLGTEQVEVRRVIETARDLATREVGSFVELLSDC